MSTIDTLLQEMTDAKAFEDRLITGYQELNALPSALLSAEAHAEVAEGLQWATVRSKKLDNAIIVLGVLKDDGFPSREQQVAPDQVIDELKSRLQLMQLAINEFVPVLIGSSTVGPEAPV